jgi:hypothetical protein
MMMFGQLKEAAIQNVKKGAYQLVYDNTTDVVNVVDNKKGKVNYSVSLEDDEMLESTMVYFGIAKKVIAN